MKKIMIFISSFFMLFILSACLENNEPIIDMTLYEEVVQHIDARLPIHINNDFLLPTHPLAEITWELEGQSFDEIFIYESPFFDRTVDLIAHITIDGTTESRHFPVLLAARDSALSVSQIYITMSIPVHDISRTEYNDVEVRIESDINGQTFEIFHTDEARIRGRGNSTWWMPKKPYRLRFNEEVSILGLPKARDYVLLAEYADKSLLRNTIVHKFSSLLGTFDHTIQTRVVELYINGHYEGLYVLTEQVEMREEKLYFESIPGVLDTGYFFELDRRFYERGIVEGFDWIVVAGVPYEIIRPNPSHQDYTAQHAEFLRQYIIDMETALIRQEGYEDYLDIDNWIDYFIIQELFKNVDVGWSSVYSYKLPGGRIKMGPLWDFDLAIGNADYIDYGPENWYGMREHKNRWFKLMMAIPEVRDRFKDRYIEIYMNYIPELLESIWVMHEAKAPLAQRNFNRWAILNHYVWPNPPEMVQATTYEAQVSYVYHFIRERADWMLSAVQSEAFEQGIFDE